MKGVVYLLKESLIIAKGEYVKIELGFSDESKIIERLRTKYNSRKKTRRVMMIQRLYEIHYNEEEFHEDNADAMNFLRNVRNYCNKRGHFFGASHSAIDIVAELLQDEINRVAKSTVRKFANKGMTVDDFTSEFNEEIVRLMNQPPSNPTYAFYESLQRSYSKRAVDVVRREWGDEVKNKQRKHERRAISVEQLKTQGMLDATEARHVELDPTANVVEMDLLFEQIFSILDTQECEILRVMYSNGGDASNREIERMTGINYQKVERIKRKIKTKVSEAFGGLGDVL